MTTLPIQAVLAASGGRHSSQLPPPSRQEEEEEGHPEELELLKPIVLLSCPASASVAALTLARGHGLPAGPSQSQELALQGSPLFMVRATWVRGVSSLLQYSIGFGLNNQFLDCGWVKKATPL